MTSVSDNRASLGGGKNHNQPSASLSAEQNEQLFQLLGSKKFTQSTGIAQIFSTEPPAHSAWVKRHTGVLCFVKDHIRKSYYMQMYCLNREELIWEHEVYEPFIMHNPRPYMLTFEGSDRIVSFNFVSNEEATGYFQTVRDLMSSRMRKQEERSRRTARPVNQNVTSNRNNGDESVALRKPKHSITTTKPVVHDIYSTKPMTTMPVKTTKSSKRDKKPVKKVVTKADIGTPSGFQHVTHVGWDSYKGFNFKGEDEEVLKPFLEKAGVTDKLLNNRETKAFILDFIQEKKVLESIKSEKTGPPVPIRTSKILPEPNQQKPNRVAPPPPQNKASPHPTNPVPKPPRVNMPEHPKRSPPIINTPNKGSGPPGPPPPPPPPVSMPPPPPMMEPSHDKPSSPRSSDPHSALLDSIRQGAKLKKVGEKPTGTSTTSGGSGRNDLLDEIRQGTKLRPAEDRVVSDQPSISDETSSSDALALALKRALEHRKTAIQSDSNDDTDESFDNDDEWED